VTAQPHTDVEACACTPEVPCGLHYAERRRQERRRIRVRRPLPEDRRFFCKTCHTSAGGVSPPDGWFRIQRADRTRERETHYLFQTTGLYCSAACLLQGAARQVEARPGPNGHERLHQLVEQLTQAVAS
jgi:hypothetical protein